MKPPRLGSTGLAALLAILAALAAWCALQAHASTARSPKDIDTDLREVTVERLRALYAARTYTVTEVVQWHLDRIARYDGVYHAMIHVDRAGALAAATVLDREPFNSGRGPLWGVPIAIKANTSVKGLVTSNGWRGYMIPGHEWLAPEDAAVIMKLRAGGAVILGQTNMPDFASGDTTESLAGGRTGNAYDWRYSPGGSSGGSVTAVAAGFVVIATGTDTSNSIRTPSGASGVVGVLPTRGLVEMAGIHPFDWLLDNTGPIARTVVDAEIALRVMSGDESPPSTSTTLKGKRFGTPAFMLAELGYPPFEKETQTVFMKALDGLRTAGAEVVIDPALLPENFVRAADAVNTRPYIMEGIENYFRAFGPTEYRSRAAFEKSTGLSFPLAAGAQSALPFAADPNAEASYQLPKQRALALYEEAFERFKLDGLVYPALHSASNDETDPRTAMIGGPHSRTAWVNVIGVPAVVVPAGYYANGLPFGIEMSARVRKDWDLLAWATAYEAAVKVRHPPVLKEVLKEKAP